MDTEVTDRLEQAAWPFTGRADELEQARRALAAGRGVIVFGDGGVGKTRLAAELTSGTGGPGPWYRISGAAGTGGVAFGAWSHLLPDSWGALDEAQAWLALAEHLRGADGAILLAVDDAHGLDPGSAALLHHLVTAHGALVVVTSRRDAPAAAPIAALWKDHHLARLDLERLTAPEVGMLIERTLGAPVEPRTVESVYDRSGGDLLLVRELVADGVRTDGIRLVHGAWVEVAPSAPSARVVDLLAGRLDALAPDQRSAAELIALAAPARGEILAEAVPSEVVDHLVEQGLVRVDGDGTRCVATAGYSLVAEVLVERLGPGRRAEALRTLVDLYDRATDLDDDETLRLATWRIDIGRTVDPDEALRAADLALARRDAVVAEGLAAAAMGAGGGPAAVIRLGEALWHQERHAEAEAALAPVASHLGDLDDDLRYRYAAARAMALATDLGRLDDAIAVLSETIATMGDDRSRWALEARLSFLLADCGRHRDARPLAEARVANVAVDEPSALTALVAWCLIHTDAGRCRDTLELCEAMTPVALRHTDDRPEALAWIAAAQLLAHYVAGDLKAAGELLELMELFTADDPDPTVRAGLLMSQGLLLSERGRLDAALRVLRQCAALHAVDNRRGYQAWCLAITARVHALRGETQQAEEALAAARGALWPSGQAFTGDIHVAAIWVAMLRGDRAGAAQTLAEAVAAAEAEGREAIALRLRHEAIRAGLPVEPHVAAFARTTAAEQSAWARADAAHVAALAADDGAGLVAAGTALAELGLHLEAAEAYAQGAGAHRRAGSPALAVQAKQLSDAQHARCESAATPALRFGELVVGLTDREVDVTTRAAAGASNQEIAAGLGISVRTAETHLQRAFAKLGVHRRGDLGALFGTPASPNGRAPTTP